MGGQSDRFGRGPSICFVAHNAYGALARVDTGHIGGIERQTSLMARWFAAHGYPVSMITWDEGQPDGVTADGVRVFKMCRNDDGIKGLRFLHPKWTSLCRAMRRADADIYYYNCGDLGLGQVVMWCRRHNRKCVYSVASDADCDPRLPKLKFLRERVLFKHGVRQVDSIIVQTQRQQRMLGEGFGAKPTVIPMPCESPREKETTRVHEVPGEHAGVLWVGRISREKRLEWLLDVAEQCPQNTFDVAGASNTDSEYARVLTKRAAAIPNVRMHGRVPYSDMAKYYQRCHILCCTSVYEGFPNTFLEAWALGMPVVSTFDPDGIIARENLGWTTASIDQIVESLKAAIASPEKWHAASHAARTYYLKNHTMDATMPKFEKLFLDVTKS